MRFLMPSGTVPHCKVGFKPSCPCRRPGFVLGCRTMARQCDYCGKKKIFGHNVSHANNKTHRVFMPNLRRVRVMKSGKSVLAKICTVCLKLNRHLTGAPFAA